MRVAANSKTVRVGDTVFSEDEEGIVIEGRVVFVRSPGYITVAFHNGETESRPDGCDDEEDPKYFLDERSANVLG